jgi:hypothetical protein
LNCAAALWGRPIERIWCVVKNPIADDPVKNMTELDQRLRVNFLGDEAGNGCCVTEKVLLSSYRQTHEHEVRYAAYALDITGEFQAPEDLEDEEDLHALVRSTAEDTDEED